MVLSAAEYQNMTSQELAGYLRSQGVGEEEIALAVAQKGGNDSVLERRGAMVEHMRNVNAFEESLVEMSADRVLSSQEARDLCFKAPQWRAQLEAAQDFVVEFREDYPQAAVGDTSLEYLELKAGLGLEVVDIVEAECE